MLISLFRVASWFDAVSSAVARWMKFGEGRLHEHDLELFDYNVWRCFGPNIMCFWYYLQFFNLTLKNSKVVFIHQKFLHFGRKYF